MNADTVLLNKEVLNHVAGASPREAAASFGAVQVFPDTNVNICAVCGCGARFQVAVTLVEKDVAVAQFDKWLLVHGHCVLNRQSAIGNRQ